jgi:hypothetical protein
MRDGENWVKIGVGSSCRYVVMVMLLIDHFVSGLAGHFQQLRIKFDINKAFSLLSSHSNINYWEVGASATVLQTPYTLKASAVYHR